MSNQNGHISSSDVSATGAVDSNFYLRKGQPIAIPSPLEIVSPDGTEVATLSVDNTGVLTIASDEIVFDPTNNYTIVVGDATGDGAGLQVKPKTQTTGVGGISLFNGSDSTTPTYYTTYNASITAGGLTAGHLQTYGYSGAGGSIVNQISDCTVTGSQINLGSSNTIGGTVVSINGFLGPARVFDEQYNPPPTAVPIITTQIAATFSSNTLTNNVVGSFAIPVIGLATGTYFISLGVKLGFSDDTVPPDIPVGTLQAWLNDPSTLSEGVYPSQIAITNSMMASRPTSTAITNAISVPFLANYFSGFFTLTAGIEYTLNYAWWSDNPITFGGGTNVMDVRVVRIQ